MVEFYKKTNVTTDPSKVKDVNLYGNYSDLADGTSTNLKITGGADSVISLLQFPVSPSSKAGSARIKRFDLKFFVDDIEASKVSSGALAYDVFNLKRNTSITEGSIATETTDAIVVGSNVSSSVTSPVYTEDLIMYN